MKQNALPCKFFKKFKKPLFHCREVSDRKYWWSGKTLSVLSKIIWSWKFFHKISDKNCLKVGEIKKSEFQKLCVWRSGNCKQRFFITWIFYQLTNLCSNYAIQWDQMSDTCLEKLAIKKWFPFNFTKKFKGPSFCGWWVEELETFTKHMLWCLPSKKCIVKFSAILICLLLRWPKRQWKKRNSKFEGL